MGKFHYFRFCWGYVESARIATLPCWYHLDGFETVEEAARSFADALEQFSDAKERICPNGHDQEGKFCSECGEETKIIKRKYAALEAFDALYTIDADRAPSSNTERWDPKWYAEWELGTTAQNLKPIVVQGFERALEEQDMNCIIVES